jgi:hypothetical protein
VIVSQAEYEEATEAKQRKRTTRHPVNAHFCGCVHSCMLTKAECRRLSVRCRYRREEVRPLSHCIVIKAEQTEELEEEGR